MGARWYLACIAMLALLCVAAHLSIQQHAQQRAEGLLQQWGKKAQVQIGNVRYHLLRNALIVQQIHVSREGGSLSIAHMLIRANPKLLTSNSPQIGEIEVDGVQAQLWAPGAEKGWQQDEYLKRIWHASRSLSLRDGELALYLQGKTKPPLKMTGLKLKQDYLNQQRRLVGTAHTQGGDVHLQWQTNEKHELSSGQLHWQEVEAQPLSLSLGLQPVVGLLKGYMSWTHTDSAQPGMPASTIEGQIQLNNADDESDTNHQLHWQGSQVAETWKMEMKAKAWPLDAWADMLPQIGGRQILAGQLDGLLQWRGRPGRWTVHAKQGALHNIIYTQKNERETTDWRVGRLEYKNALIDQSKHYLQASSILLADSSITLQPVSSLAVEVSERKFEGDWHIAVQNIRIQNMTLGLRLQQGKVTAASLHGKGRWKSGEALNFKLQTQTAVGKAGIAQAGETVEEAEYWQFHGQVLRNKSALNDAKLKIRARDVPLAKLRALVPLTGSETLPLTLEGNTSLKLDVSVRDGVWQAEGIATAEHVVLAHAGDTWKMDHLAMTFGPVGMGLSSQSIDLLEVQGWKYIAALNPLSAYSAEASPETDVTAQQAAWWVRPLRRQNWKIGSVRLNSGTISLGRSEDHWARQLDIHLDRLQMNQWSKLHIEGKVGSGDFTLKGTWDALGEVNRFRGTASLQNALPFFLNNWMTASNMPRLIRGRIFADLSVDAGDTPDSYQSSVQLKFLRGLTEMSSSPDDPLLSRIGFGTSDTLLRLDDGTGTAALQFETMGSWKTRPLNLDRLGLSMQSALRQMEQGGASPEEREQTIETRIRLHEGGSLSLNERSRLFKAVRLLRKNPNWVVDLIPHWTGDEINADVLKRVLYTQNLIERYLSHRRVGKQRIFPLWPTAGNHADEIGSIWVSVGPPA